VKKLLSYLLAAVLLLSVLVGGPAIGPYGIDSVSAATGDEAAPAPAKSTGAKASSGTTASGNILVEGSFGKPVEYLQTVLNDMGYSLKVDGFYGKKTKAAVEDFQKKSGLRVDGMAGPKTFALLTPAAPAAPISTLPEIEAPATPAVPAVPATPATPAADAVTSASIVNEAAAFEKAISKDGTWIIATLNDLTVKNELVLDGEFHDKNDPAKDLKRKIALYTQDDKHNVTARFTLTAPKLTVKSPKSTIQHGTFVGDVYVESEGFSLVDNKVVGNVYFATQKAKDTFIMDDKSTITGKQVVAGVDAVTSASLVQDTAAFENAISKNGTWIIAVLNNLTFSKPLVLEGDFVNTKTPPVSSRKIALYSQDAERNTISSFTLTAPKLTIKSPDANISKGTFKGDLYVSAKNFKLVAAKVDGNVYFTTQEAKDTFAMDEKSSITGSKILFDVDAVSSATQTQVQNVEAFEKAISKDGYWIIVPITDLATDKALVLEGEFHDKNDATKPLKRKIGLYTHNNPEDKKIATHLFTLTAPSLTIKSPYATLQYGYFVGDIYVEANNFNLTKNKVTGNIYFATQEAKDTFTMDADSSVSGVQEVRAK